MALVVPEDKDRHGASMCPWGYDARQTVGPSAAVGASRVLAFPNGLRPWRNTDTSTPRGGQTLSQVGRQASYVGCRVSWIRQVACSALGNREERDG